MYILGGYQTDFARNITREGKTLHDLMRESVEGALAAAKVEAKDVEVGHVGNFVAETFVGQGHLGALLVECDPAFVGLPTSRHEAACASGSAAISAAMADLEAGRYDLALVVGVELMRNVSASDAQARLGAAAWVPQETDGITYPWPEMFSRIADAYRARYGLERAHLQAISQHNFAQARRNPNAQTRNWTFDETSFSDDDNRNPIVAGTLRRYDCSQITDGAVALVIGSERFARPGEAKILGWGQRTAQFSLRDKLALDDGPYMFPHVRRTITDAFRRADVESVDVIECHDCFSISEYMAIDHFALAPAGQPWRALEAGWLERVNPSGGLIGAGHPVGATGVRMLLDAAKQVTGRAGEYQLPDVKRAATLNLGGSATTSISFVVGA